MATETTMNVAKDGSAKPKKGARNTRRGHKRKRAAKTTRPRKPRAARTKATPKRSSRRRQSTRAQRAKILATADRQGLTALEVHKRFGVKPVTYYSWRKQRGTAKRGARRGAGRTAGGDLGNQVRTEVQTKVRQILPAVVRAEVSNYLDAAFGSTRGRRGRD